MLPQLYPQKAKTSRKPWLVSSRPLSRHSMAGTCKFSGTNVNKLDRGKCKYFWTILFMCWTTLDHTARSRSLLPYNSRSGPRADCLTTFSKRHLAWRTLIRKHVFRLDSGLDYTPLQSTIDWSFLFTVSVN